MKFQLDGKRKILLTTMYNPINIDNEAVVLVYI